MQGLCYVYVHMMVVVPNFLRWGVAAGLLRCGLEHADACGLKAWMDARSGEAPALSQVRLEVPLEECSGKEGQMVNPLTKPKQRERCIKCRRFTKRGVRGSVLADSLLLEIAS